MARLLRRERLRCRLSQAEAARQAGVSGAYLCQVERGRKAPSERLAERLEPVYGVRSGRFVSKYRFPRRRRRAWGPEAGAALRGLMAAEPVPE
ncbi:MAG TPA: helix-turn-helix transcriptional regulator [Candidatus Xenobia bacterium]